MSFVVLLFVLCPLLFIPLYRYLCFFVFFKVMFFVVLIFLCSEACLVIQQLYICTIHSIVIQIFIMVAFLTLKVEIKQHWGCSCVCLVHLQFSYKKHHNLKDLYIFIGIFHEARETMFEKIYILRYENIILRNFEHIQNV